MDDPSQSSETDEPQNTRAEKKNKSHEHPTLNELAKTGYEKTAKGGNNISSGSRASAHGANYPPRPLDAQAIPATHA